MGNGLVVSCITVQRDLTRRLKVQFVLMIKIKMCGTNSPHTCSSHVAVWHQSQLLLCRFKSNQGNSNSKVLTAAWSVINLWEHSVFTFVFIKNIYICKQVMYCAWK